MNPYLGLCVHAYGAIELMLTPGSVNYIYSSPVSV